MQKPALVVVVAGVIALGIHSVMSKSDQERNVPGDDSALRAKLQSAQIYPTTAYTNNVLQIKMKNATRDDYQRIEVKWFCNGETIEGGSDHGLTPEQFQKGDEIHAEVGLLEAASGFEPILTSAVRILNTPPQIVECSANLKTEGSDVIYARVNCVDADDDGVEYHFRWFKNGVEVAGANGSVFDLGQCEADDVVYAMIVASDGEDESSPRRSESITIGSGVPRITSQPPQLLTEDRVFVYQLSTTANDARNLTYELLEAPTGMNVSQEGMINWELPAVQAGAQQYDIVIRITNSLGGEAYQEFSIATAGTVDHQAPR